MRRLLAVIIASTCIAAPALADTIDVLRENTLLLHAADGKIHTILVKEGVELEQVNSSGMWARGFWAIKNETFCWTARGASEVCIAMPADKNIGDTWEIKGPTGKVVWTAEIQAGRVDLKAVGEDIKASEAIDAAAAAIEAAASDDKE
jgi:hypothetical protein